MSKFLRWIVNIVLIVAIVVACGLLIPPVAGVKTIIVDDVDMPTNLDRGSVTYGVPKKVEELKVGDDVIMQDSQGDYVYRLTKIDAGSGECELEDIKSTDGGTITETYTEEVSKVFLTVPFIGYVTMAMKSTEGLIIIGLGVIFIIILFILSELWKKDKDEDDEEYEEEEEAIAPSVDMSAQILEKVSSEIGSEVSNVIAEDTDQLEIAGAINAVAETMDNGVVGDTVSFAIDEKAVKEETVDMAKELERAVAANDKAFKEKAKAADKADDVQEEVEDKVDDVQEVVEDKADDVQEVVAKVDDVQGVAADDADEAVIGEIADAVEETLVEELPTEEFVEEPVEEAEEELEEDLEPVEMAMPMHTAEELIQKAKDAGYEPEVNKDEELEITILDYSKIL